MTLRQHPFFFKLRKIKNDAVDFYRMQRYYGVAGKLISVLSNLPFLRKKKFHKSLSQPLTQFAWSNPANCQTADASSADWKVSQKNWPTISVITPVLNQASTLEACVASLLNQNYPNLEYIIIDLGSNDESIKIIKGHSSQLSYWCSKPYPSKAHAINEGIAHATGEILNWLEAEDRLEPGALFACAEAFLTNPQSAAWVGASRRIGPDGRQLGITYPNGLERDHLAINWNGSQFGQASCFLSLLKVKEMGALNEDFPNCFALDMWIRLLEKGVFLIGKGIWSRMRFPTNPEKTRQTLIQDEWARLKKNHDIIDRLESTRKHFSYRVSHSFGKQHPKMQHRETRSGNFDKRLKIAVFGYGVPRFDKAASEYRLHKIIQILLDNHCRVDYLYKVATHDDDRYKASFRGDINFFKAGHEIGDYFHFLDKSYPDLIWASDLWRINYIKFVVQLLKEIKSKSNHAKIIVDTVDFHYKEFQRKYQQTGHPDDLNRANQYLDLEKQVYPMADLITVVSQEEKNDILTHIKGTNRIEVIPIIYNFPNNHRSYIKRCNICFIGNFGTTHNVDAVHYFLDCIFPHMLKTNPTLEFHVIGFFSEKYRKDFTHPNVKVVGSLRNLHKALESYRLFACPLTYGAGMKGKIGDAMITGTPVVTTSLGAEGFPVKDGRELFIADCPEQFAEKSLQVINDPATWNHFSSKSKLMMIENFSAGVVARQLGAILSA